MGSQQHFVYTHELLLAIPIQEDIRFGIEHDVDMVFASFVRKAEDVAEIRKELGERGKHILIVSKVISGYGLLLL